MPDDKSENTSYFKFMSDVDKKTTHLEFAQPVFERISWIMYRKIHSPEVLVLTTAVEPSGMSIYLHLHIEIRS